MAFLYQRGYLTKAAFSLFMNTLKLLLQTLSQDFTICNMNVLIVTFNVNEVFNSPE